MEVLAPPPVSAPRIEASEEAGAMPLFQLYADHVGMSAKAVATGSDILRVCPFDQALNVHTRP